MYIRIINATATPVRWVKIETREGAFYDQDIKNWDGIIEALQWGFDVVEENVKYDGTNQC